MKKITLFALFIFVCLSLSAQTINSITPNSAAQGEKFTVSISGTNTSFLQGTSTTLMVYLSQGSTNLHPITGTVNAVDDENVEAEFYFPHSFPYGIYDVNARTQYGANLTFLNGFELFETYVAPYDLEGDVNGTDASFSWKSPTPFIPQWRRHDNGVNYGGMGSTDVSEYSVAAKFDSIDLYDLDGGNITKISFYPKEASPSYTIRIWTGVNGDYLAYEQAVPIFTTNEWNEVILTTPFEIDASETIWLGYYIENSVGLPAGVDASRNYINGNYIGFGFGWMNGVGGDLNIKGYFEPSNNTKSFTGNYNIYLDDMTLGNEFATGITNEFYDFTNLANGNYTFGVSAVYETGTSDIETIMFNITSIEELLKNNTSIFPNPSTGDFIINTTEICHLEIFDISGQLIHKQTLDSSTNKVKVSDNGVYSLRISNKKTSFVQKVIVK